MTSVFKKTSVNYKRTDSLATSPLGFQYLLGGKALYTTLTILTLHLVALVVFPLKVHAFELAAGAAATEESDDRLRPSVVAHMGFGEHFFSRFYLYGRNHGIVQERTSLWTLNYRFPLFGANSFWYGGTGLALLNEQFILKEPGDPEVVKEKDSQQNIIENNYNFGILFSINWSFPTSPFYLSFAWDAHLFLAGQAGVFLSTGRKQMLSLQTGLRL